MSQPTGLQWQDTDSMMSVKISWRSTSTQNGHWYKHEHRRAFILVYIAIWGCSFGTWTECTPNHKQSKNASSFLISSPPKVLNSAVPPGNQKMEDIPPAPVSPTSGATYARCHPKDSVLPLLQIVLAKAHPTSAVCCEIQPQNPWSHFFLVCSYSDLFCQIQTNSQCECLQHNIIHQI